MTIIEQLFLASLFLPAVAVLAGVVLLILPSRRAEGGTVPRHAAAGV